MLVTADTGMQDTESTCRSIAEKVVDFVNHTPYIVYITVSLYAVPFSFNRKSQG